MSSLNQTYGMSNKTRVDRVKWTNWDELEFESIEYGGLAAVTNSTITSSETLRVLPGHRLSLVATVLESSAEPPLEIETFANLNFVGNYLRGTWIPWFRAHPQILGHYTNACEGDHGAQPSDHP